MMPGQQNTQTALRPAAQQAQFGRAQSQQPQPQGTQYNPQQGGNFSAWQGGGQNTKSFGMDSGQRDQAMAAWAQPKQQLLQWGQNLPQFAQYQPQQGADPQQLAGRNAALVQQINNAGAAQQVGTYLGQGAPPPDWGNMQLNQQQMLSNANQMVQQGFQNPFAMQASQQVDPGRTQAPGQAQPQPPPAQPPQRQPSPAQRGPYDITTFMVGEEGSPPNQPPQRQPPPAQRGPYDFTNNAVREEGSPTARPPQGSGGWTELLERMSRQAPPPAPRPPASQQPLYPGDLSSDRGYSFRRPPPPAQPPQRQPSPARRGPYDYTTLMVGEEGSPPNQPPSRGWSWG